MDTVLKICHVKLFSYYVSIRLFDFAVAALAPASLNLSLCLLKLLFSLSTVPLAIYEQLWSTLTCFCVGTERQLFVWYLCPSLRKVNGICSFRVNVSFTYCLKQPTLAKESERLNRSQRFSKLETWFPFSASQVKAFSSQDFTIPQ